MSGVYYRHFLSEDDLTENITYKSIRYEGARKSISHFILQQTNRIPIRPSMQKTGLGGME